jgi:hypothetical protein
MEFEQSGNSRELFVRQKLRFRAAIRAYLVGLFPRFAVARHRDAGQQIMAGGIGKALIFGYSAGAGCG